MVEYYPSKLEAAKEKASLASSEPDSDDEKESPDEMKKISEGLAALGVYARSMNKQNWLTEDLSHSFHILINISESALDKLAQHSSTMQALVANGRELLRRVYPKGTRIESGNQDPLVCWRAGSHFAALNWQDFDRGMQLNEAMFYGTGGWVLKPAHLRGEEVQPKKVKIDINVAGLSSLPRVGGETEISLRVRIHLLHQDGDLEWKSKSTESKVSPDGVFDAQVHENCSWTAKVDELAFIRILITQDKYGLDEHRAVFCARLQSIQQGWRFVRLLDTKGRDSHATLLVHFAMTDED